MMRRALQILAGAALAATAITSQASAGGCCTACVVPAVPCVTSRYIPVVNVPSVVPIYVVNQGPTYTGPGIMTYPGYFDEYHPRTNYPYVAVDYPYPRYHGWRHSHHVKRVYRSSTLHPYGK
jgi:hypothetical protein